MKVPARSTEHITISAESKRSDTIVTSMEIQWQMGYITGFMEPEFMLNGTEIVDLSPSDLKSQISFPGRDIFLDDYQVMIEHPYGEGAELRYTTDGSEPVANSPLFTEGLKLDKTTNLRVRFQSPDGYTSETSGKTFPKSKGNEIRAPSSPQAGDEIQVLRRKLSKCCPILTNWARPSKPE